MNGRSGMLLVLAVVCGLGAMYGVRKLLSKDQATVETRDVLVAAREIKAEEVLKDDMVKIIQVPKALAPTGAATTFKEVEGRWVKIALLADETIVEAKLAPKNAPVGLTPRIPKGMRAVAIEVNEKTGVSGFVLPDHRVDVIQTRSVPGSAIGASEAETILEDVQVLAAGNTTTRPEDKSIQVRTVTLALPPDQVDVIVAAGAKGPLSLSLRGVNDHAPARPAKKIVKEPTQPVLVATRDLKPDEPIRADMVTVKELPRSEAPAKAAAALGEVEGKSLQIPIFAGEPILTAKLVGEKPLGVSPGVRPRSGMRAVSIEVDDKTGVAGAVQTNHSVDVIWTSGESGGKADGASGAATAPISTPAPAPSATEGRIVLQDVRVLEAPYRSPQIKDRSGQTWVVTLEVHARDLASLAVARANGTLMLALRDPDDHRRYTPPQHIPAQFVERQGAIFSGLMPPQRYLIERRQVSPDVYLNERFDEPSEPEAVTVFRGR